VGVQVVERENFESSAQSASNRGTILIVDAAPAGDDLARELRQLGMSVQVAVDAATALSLAAAQPPDLALVELKLGPTSGLDLLAPLAHVSPSTRIAIVTMYGSIDSVRVAMSRGAVDYLTKPVTILEILTLLSDGPIQSDEAGSEVRMNAHAMRRAYIEEVLAHCGSLSRASRVLRVDRRSLRRMRQRLSIKG
jgi:two-component system, response regulator RegA